MASYIHEREGWPSFKWGGQALADQLAAVRHRQGRLQGRMEALGFVYEENRRRFLIESM
jgi:hypothetical protein